MVLLYVTAPLMLKFKKDIVGTLYFKSCVCLALHSQSAIMVMSGQPVNLITPLLGRLRPPKQLISTK